MSYLDPWEEITGEKRDQVLAVIPVKDSLRNDPGALAIFEKHLPFYTGWSLVRLKLKNDDGSFAYFHLVWSPVGKFQLIDWSAASIHTINGRCDLRLNETTVGDYLRFYSDYVADHKGPFTIIEDQNHSRFEGVDRTTAECTIYPEQDKPEGAVRPGNLLDQILPVKIVLRNDSYHAEAFHWHDKTISMAKYKISFEGEIIIIESEDRIRLSTSGTTIWHINEYRVSNG